MEIKIDKERVKDELYELFISIGFEEYFSKYSDKTGRSKKPNDPRGTTVGKLNLVEIIFQMAYNDSQKKLDDLSISLENEDPEARKKNIAELKVVRNVADELLTASLAKRFYQEGYEISVFEGSKVQILPCSKKTTNQVLKQKE